MRIRVRKISNGKWVVEVKKLFRWYLIHVDVLRSGDAHRKTMNDDFMDYVLKTTTNYNHHIRYSEGSVDTHEIAITRAKHYASSHGLSRRDHCLEGDVGN